MDNINEFDENELKQIKMQNDLIKLMQAIDECMEQMDKFYFHVRKKQMLAGSNDN